MQAVQRADSQEPGADRRRQVRIPPGHMFLPARATTCSYLWLLACMHAPSTSWPLHRRDACHLHSCTTLQCLCLVAKHGMHAQREVVTIVCHLACMLLSDTGALTMRAASCKHGGWDKLSAKDSKRTMWTGTQAVILCFEGCN